MPVLRMVEARSRRERGERTSTCLGSRSRPRASTGAGKSATESRPAHLSSVTTRGRGSLIGLSPGSTTTASPERRPEGTAMTSPLRSRSSEAAAAARRLAVFCRASAFSRAEILRLRSKYSPKSPRWQVADSRYPASASSDRSILRDSPTTDRSAWNWAKDCSSSSRAAGVPTRWTRFTAML